MKKINWGIIGLGNIAHKFLGGFKNVKNSNILAIGSKNYSKLKKFKEEFKIEKKFVFSNYDELINCKEVDAVYISLPNSFHYEMIVKCIKKKKKILVEKPATLTFLEAQKIVSAIKKNEIFFAEGFMYRFNPQINKIIEIINNNEIGNLISMESSFGVNILTKKKFFLFTKKKKINKDNRLFNKKLGGGCILDLGCYPTSFSLLIASTINNLDINQFEVRNNILENGETGVDIDAEADLRFDERFNSNIRSSFKKNLGNKSIIRGDKGNMVINNTFLEPDGISINGVTKFYKVEERKYENLFSYEIENISKSILDGLTEVYYPGMQINETLINMKILDSWKNEY